MKKDLLCLTLFICSFPMMIWGQGFANVAESNNLDFSYQTDEYGGGVSFVDFDQDGYDDLTFASEAGQPVRFFKNTGSDFVEIDNLIDDTTGSKQLLWVDYNNDGELDLYLTSENFNKLYRNNGNLELEEVTEAAGFDFPDLVSYTSTWFDYDRDGQLDLMVAHRTVDENGNIDLYRNVDLVSFEKVTIQAGLKNKGESVLAMTSFDYNNDGWQDIFLGQDWETGNVLLKNNGNGTFADVSKAAGVDFKMNSMTATVTDINQDGWQDLYVSNTTAGNILLVNNGEGFFEEKAAYYNLKLTNVTFGTVFFDADNDGDNDMHVGGLRINHTFEDTDDDDEFKRRNNDWGMTSDSEFNNGVAVGDIDNDGFIDIIKNSVSRGDFIISKNSLWQNQFTENNYLKINLEGTIGNHFGIGAKVAVHTGTKTQYKRIGCGESFSSQHSLTQHFGVKQNTAVDSVVVEWVSGNVSVISDIPVNQTIDIVEPPYGCTDVNACNYHPDAVSDNGTCRYPQQFYECLACITDSDEDGVCDELEVYGCDDYEACNFTENATENDGSCYYLAPLDITGPNEKEALIEVTYSCTPQSGSRCEWTIENGSILVNNQVGEITVIWFEKEKGTLTVQEIDATGCKGESMSREIEILPVVRSASNILTILPNPANDLIFVKHLQTAPYHYTIYNLSGQIMLTGIINEDDNEIAVSSLSAGIYILKAESENGIIQQKLYIENR